MLFKLPKSAAIVIFCSLALPNFLTAEAPSDVLAYKGLVYALRSASIRSMDMRSDGRYLFITEGGDSFFALDLNDLARISDDVTVTGNAVGVFMDGTDRLIVATTKGVEYFDVSKPLKPKVETSKFERPTNDPDYSVFDACLASDDRIVFLEKQSDDRQKLRVVTGTTASTSSTWRDLNGSDVIKPIGIQCHQGKAYVFGATGSLKSVQSLFIRSIDIGSLSVGASQPFDQGVNYRIADFLITDKKDQLLLLFNKATEPASGSETTNDSLVQVLNFPSLTTAATLGIGSKTKALASFKFGEAFRAAFFVGVDSLLGNSNNTNQLLISPLPVTSTSQIENDRGTGSANVGSKVPSRWWSSKSSDLKFGLVEAAGISMIGQGPKVDVTEGLTSENLTATSPLKFKIKADRDSVYAIYFDQSYNQDGESSGLSREPGTLIRRNNLRKNEETQIELSVSDLSISNDRRHSLGIMVYDSSLNAATAPLTRLGISFSYDPPPAAVSNLKLTSGDSSIRVRFDPPKAEDLTSYEIHFSYSASDLEGTTFSDRTFDSGVSGKTLSSPVRLAANLFGDSYAIYPVLNFQDVYVRVIAIDKGGQRSEPSALVSKKAYPTLTLPQALGSPSSCALRADSSQDPANSFVFLLALLGFLVGLRFWKKNWAQHF